ncbi:hypothetical protein FJW05_19870 [Mesorhizobium sp. B2-9-1]|uniref:hypothetical protein n=1 Tax=unclassified Mesorhizobium TaxID=325217 RepID=UPI0011299EB8|nr:MULTISPECIES: hypothetical protein [unclassified Mesorhizobium]TPI45013.1 hypothetical protein FJW05_19870 [Mesorhizobium sp. B2-9-1]TPJ30126.1 hypothetical protein FJ425_05165 [Mesorhizobium sp. B2-7-2]
MQSWVVKPVGFLAGVNQNIRSLSYSDRLFLSPAALLNMEKPRGQIAGLETPFHRQAEMELFQSWPERL